MYKQPKLLDFNLFLRIPKKLILRCQSKDYLTLLERNKHRGVQNELNKLFYKVQNAISIVEVNLSKPVKYPKQIWNYRKDNSYFMVRGTKGDKPLKKTIHKSLTTSASKKYA
jgi:hypothetical protein